MEPLPKNGPEGGVELEPELVSLQVKYMLSESWLKDKHPCLSFFQSIHKRQWVSEEKADDNQGHESDDTDHQDVQFEDHPEESEHESEHSCHVLMTWTLILQSSADLSAPEVMGH